jgi:hypothetical protein
MSSKDINDAINELIIYEEFMGCTNTFPMRSMTLQELKAPINALEEDLFDEFQYFKKRFNSQYK